VAAVPSGLSPTPVIIIIGMGMELGVSSEDKNIFDISVLMRMFGPERKEIKSGRRDKHYVKLYTMCLSQVILG
jgi:hypothetical protein